LRPDRAAADNPAMKFLARAAFSVVCASLLAGCANPKPAPESHHLLRQTCVISHEPLDADSPTVDYMDGQIGFCCNKCLAKWNKLDDAGKKKAFDEAK
jgi:hypothetical protein